MDTENGPSEYDEVNVVKPGFNSGWRQVMGPISKSGITEDELVNLSTIQNMLILYLAGFHPLELQILNFKILQSLEINM